MKDKRLPVFQRAASNVTGNRGLLAASRESDERDRGVGAENEGSEIELDRD